MWKIYVEWRIKGKVEEGMKENEMKWNESGVEEEAEADHSRLVDEALESAGARLFTVRVHKLLDLTAALFFISIRPTSFQPSPFSSSSSL